MHAAQHLVWVVVGLHDSPIIAGLFIDMNKWRFSILKENIALMNLKYSSGKSVVFNLFWCLYFERDGKH